MLRQLQLYGWTRLYIYRNGNRGYEHFAEIREVVPYEDLLCLQVRNHMRGPYGGPYQATGNEGVQIPLSDYRRLEADGKRLILYCDRSGECVHLFSEAEGAGDPARPLFTPKVLRAAEAAAPANS